MTKDLSCPLLGIFGNEDRAPSPEQVDQHEAELKRLREENRQLKIEREILKKATAFFAKENNGVLRASFTMND